jgi:hypothetical protein
MFEDMVAAALLGGDEPYVVFILEKQSMEELENEELGAEELQLIISKPYVALSYWGNRWPNPKTILCIFSGRWTVNFANSVTR